MSNEKQTASVAVTNNGINTYDLTQPLPDLESSIPVPFDLMADYWTPEAPGESKRVYFERIGMRPGLDQFTGEPIELECAFFLEQTNGDIRSISNGAKKLVGAIMANNIQSGTPLLITYLGKKKNRTNSNMSDNFSVKPLIINV